MPKLRHSHDAYRSQVIEKIQMGRVAQSRKMASGLSFLTSDDSSYMTGVELVINGGCTAQ